MKKTTNKKSTTTPANKPTLVAFLLDRSGSMDQCLAETIRGFNGYIKELRDKEDGTMRFTLTQFDSIGIDILHNADPLKEVKELNPENYSPRGYTPLYDAIGRTIRQTEKQAASKYKVLFVSLTDGLENSSTEWTSDSVKVLIKIKEEKDHWTFAYIGVGPQGWLATSKLAHGTIGASNVLCATHQDTGKVYAQFAGVTRSYACSTQNVDAPAQNLWDPSTPGKDDPVQTQ
jgi:uncharacterized protein YegL